MADSVVVVVKIDTRRLQPSYLRVSGRRLATRVAGADHPASFLTAHSFAVVKYVTTTVLEDAADGRDGTAAPGLQ